jgi:hypothetical protein
MNKELQEERDKINFDIEELTNFFHGGAENVKKKRFLGKQSSTIIAILMIISFINEKLL